MPTNIPELTEINESIDAIYKVAIISEADVRGNIIFVSDGFCDISGYTREELLGQKHNLLNSGHHPVGFFKEMWTTIAHGNIWRGQVCNRSKDGRLYWVQSTIVPIINKETGRIKKYVSFRIDITHQKATAELVLQQQTHALSQAVAALCHGQFNVDIPSRDGALISIIEAVRNLQKTLCDISEDILQLISNSTEGNLKYRADTSRYVGDYRNIVSGINRMLDIIVGATIDDGVTALVNLARGNFKTRITATYKGDYDVYKKAVNDLADNLNNLISESRMMHEATKLGRLSARIDSGKYEGDFAAITDILNQTMQEMEADFWVKDGIRTLSTAVLAEGSLAKQTNVAISSIAGYLNAGLGCLYLFNTDTRKLHLTAAYAYRPANDDSSGFALGEGIVGQVALERKAIHLTNVQTHIICTGGTREAALNTYTYPLVYKDELLGVIELASHTLIDETGRKYLNATIETLGAILFGSIQSDATAMLLARSQQLTAELEKQQTQLERQQAGLEAQAKELEMSQRSIERQNEELAHTQEAVSRQNAELVAANRYKSEFLANMSHELRTPLNSINILSNILVQNRGNNLTLKQIEQAKVIQHAGADLLQLINDILDLAKLESQKTTLRIGSVNVTSLIDDLYSMFMPITEERGIHFSCSMGDNLPPAIFTDKEKVRQVIKNFISNALKFTEKGGEIILGAYSSDLDSLAKFAVTIYVKDTGIGIPASKLKSIFEAFKQLDGSTNRKYGGTGLGLSISKVIATLLGGEITVTSNPGHGSIFALALPLILDTSGMDSDLIDVQDIDLLNSAARRTHFGNASSIKQDSSIDIGAGNNVILIIEDDQGFAETVADEALKLGLKSIIAGDGDTGLRLAKQYHPLGIILDLHLPVMNGMEVLKQLKADNDTRHIPVKIISCDEPNLIARRMGAVDFLQKPVSLESLNRMLSHLIKCTVDQEKHLLLVEDDQTLSNTLVDLLGEHASDLQISIATSGQAAVDAVKARSFDVAIVDIGLPDMSGFKLLETFKQLSCDLPIIIYSGRAFNSEELNKIHEFSESIVLKTAGSDLRLIDETLLFLHRIIKNIDGRKPAIQGNSFERPYSFAHKKILVVDDDTRNVFALTGILEETGAELFTAYNGREALDKLKQHPDIDLILMDIMMPVMNGYEAIKIIRRDNSKDQLPIIAVTAKSQNGDRQQCLDAGANDYLSKPIDTDQLMQLMKIFIG